MDGSVLVSELLKHSGFAHQMVKFQYDEDEGDWWKSAASRHQ
jgi:hypothetical protein